MKVLVIPDIHLKAWIFDRAEDILKSAKADRAVCLMDMPDDWGMEIMMSAIRGEGLKQDIQYMQSGRSCQNLKSWNML